MKKIFLLKHLIEIKELEVIDSCIITYNLSYIYKLIFIIIFSSISKAGLSQCTQPALLWLDQVEAIENSDDPINLKLSKLENLKKSYESCNKSDDSIYARIIHRAGNYYMQIGLYEKSLALTSKAISINKQNKASCLKSYIANSYFNVGLLYNEINIFNKAQAYFDSCIYIAKNYPHKSSLLIRALEHQSYSYTISGDFEKSLENSELSLGIVDHINDPEAKSAILLQMIQALNYLNKYTLLEKKFPQLLLIAGSSSVSDDFRATTYAIYAGYLKKMKKFNISIKYFNRANHLYLTGKSTFNNSSGMRARALSSSKVLYELGNMYENELDNPKQALIVYEEAIQLLKKNNYKYELPQFYNSKGDAFRRLGNYSLALKIYQKSLVSFPIEFTNIDISHNPNIQQLKLVTNEIEIFNSLQGKGITFLEIFKKTKINAHLLFAIDCFTKASFMIDQMRWKQFNDQSKLFWRNKSHNMFENAIETCYLLGDVEKAFYFFEKSRAVLLNDKLNEIGAKQFLNQEGLAKEQHLRIKIITAQNKIENLSPEDVHFTEAREKYIVAKDSLEKFIKHLEKLYPMYYQYKYDNKTYTTAQIAKKFINATLVEYFTAEDCIYAITISGNKKSIKKIDIKNYHEKAAQLLVLCADKTKLNQNYQAFENLSQMLHDSLFLPLNIQTKKVVISQDDNFIPFEVLLSKKGKSDFLINHFAFSYTYSASCMMKDTSKAIFGGNGMLGVAPVSFQANLKQQKLVGSDVSLEKIKKYIHSGTYLESGEASKQNFLSALPDYPIVHLYSHATGGGEGKEPELYLADSILKVHELQTLQNVKTKLIFLSACQTGLGRHVPGEGVFSLARGFAAAGIPSTITTLWEIDSKSTYEITELFYKYLSEGQETDEALRNAKLAFIKNNDSEKSMPYFWAANILIGNVYQLKQSTNMRYWYWLIGGCFMVIMILLFVMYNQKSKKKPKIMTYN